jgi:membrane-bound lytic murein transglycosylase D
MGMGRHILRRKALAAILLLRCVFSFAAGDASASEPLPPRLEAVNAVPDSSIPRGEVPNALAPIQGHRGEMLLSLPAPEDVIASWEKSYLTKKRDWLQSVNARLPLYRRVIEERLETLMLPRDLLYLPAVESGFYVKATSPRGAAGIWQLMANTAGPFGLVMDQWVDERRDFVKATDASLQKLSEDYRRFGDWALALAAYNCGATRLSGIIRESGVSDYWVLRRRGKLPRETASFVPQFIAVARILSYPGRYGLDAGWHPSVSWARVAVDGSVDLRTLCREAEAPFDLISGGNAELKNPFTPPASYRYSLKVPIEYRDAVITALARNERGLMDFKVHIVREGDTLSEIARSYGIPLEMIVEFNPPLKPNALRIGSRIMVPTKGRSG